MKTITDLFKQALAKHYERNYPYFYIAVDLHGTIFVPDKLTMFTWGDGSSKPSEIKFERILKEKIYPNAIECLKYFCLDRSIDDVDYRLILWTSGKGDELLENLKLLEDNGIYFQYINENPDFKGNSYADFSKKFCFDILLDDKAGFDPEHDWTELLRFLKTTNISHNGNVNSESVG